ncbi:MAG: DUF488 domain-containing protein [Candidatus Manganitrophaceae bacterium]
MKIFTIGFTKTSAERFFTRLKKARPKRIIDVRLNNVSQLSGFAKRDDLRYFVHEICGMEYIHVPEFVPTKDILDNFKKNGGDWHEYEKKFLGLIQERCVENLDQEMLNDGCLLCSEDKPHYCHRRLVAEYFRRHWDDVEIVHL